MDNDGLLRLIFKWRVDVSQLERSNDQEILSIAVARANDANELESLLITQAQGIQ